MRRLLDSAIGSAQLGKLLAHLSELNEIGVALSSERDINKLLETILISAKKITNADAGTLYLLDDKREGLRFEIVLNDTLNTVLGGTSGNPIPFWPVQLYIDGQPNLSTVVSCAALQGETINIPDAYVTKDFDFSGTKNFDTKTGYRSRSFLAVPMRNHEQEIIGVVQLINAMDSETKAVQPFSVDDEQLLESLASQAAIAISNRRLIEQLEGLVEGLINSINTAIDDKSPYTGKHCERLPILTMMLADAVTHAPSHSPLHGFSLSEQDKYELKIASLLHDCGKIATPVHVVDKRTKLETIFDRIELLATRFEVLKRDAEIDFIKKTACDPAPARREQLHVEYLAKIQQLDDDFNFLKVCNLGSEKMKLEDQQRIHLIAQYQWRNAQGDRVNFLTSDELANLTIRSGTLTADERQIINNHIKLTIKMLESLPWPQHLKNVPEFAGGHHERMDGKGYPNGLKKEQMSIQARMMGLSDIFEALTASDRPYKSKNTISEALYILGKMAVGGHVDPDLMDIFIRQKVYWTYAEQFLDPDQLDLVDEAKIPGYIP